MNSADGFRIFPKFFPRGFRKVTCLFQARQILEGHELFVGSLSFVLIVLWISVSLFSIVFLGWTRKNGVKDSFRTGSNPQFLFWFVITELNFVNSICSLFEKLQGYSWICVVYATRKNSVMSITGKKSNWSLSVFITNLSTEKSVEVNGETHIGKLMLDLVEGLGKCLQW